MRKPVDPNDNVDAKRETKPDEAHGKNSQICRQRPKRIKKDTPDRMEKKERETTESRHYRKEHTKQDGDHTREKPEWRTR